MEVLLVQSIAAGGLGFGHNVVANRQGLGHGDAGTVGGIDTDDAVGVQLPHLELSALQVRPGYGVYLLDLDAGVLVVLDGNHRLLAVGHLDLGALVGDGIAIRGLGLNQVVDTGLHIHSDEGAGGIGHIVTKQLAVVSSQLELGARQGVTGGSVDLADGDTALRGVGYSQSGGLAFHDFDAVLLGVEHIAHRGRDLFDDVPAGLDTGEAGLTALISDEGVADLFAVHGVQPELGARQGNLALSINLLDHEGGLLIVLQFQQGYIEILDIDLMLGAVQQVALRGLNLLDEVVALVQVGNPDVAVLASGVLCVGRIHRRAILVGNLKYGTLQGQAGDRILLQDSDTARLVVTEQNSFGLASLQVDDLFGILRQQVARRSLDFLDDVVAGLQSVDAGQAIRAGHQTPLHNFAVRLAQLKDCIGQRQAGLLIFLADVQGSLAIVTEDQEHGFGLADPDLKGLRRAVDEVPIRGLNLAHHIAAGLQAIQSSIAVGAGHQVGVDHAATSGGNSEAGTCQGLAGLIVLFQNNQLGVLEVGKGHQHRVVVVDNLDDAGLRIQHIAIRHADLSDFIHTGHNVRDVDDAVFVGQIGTGFVGGIGSFVAIAQVADLELHALQGLVGNGVVLGDGQALAGVVLNIKLDDTVRVGGNHDLPFMGIREVIARRGRDLG